MSESQPHGDSLMTLATRPALPFLLTNLGSGQDRLVLENILNRLAELERIALAAQTELRSLRRAAAISPGTVTPASNADADSATELDVSPRALKLTLRLLGPVEVRVGEAAISSWPGRKARLLLAYLALERGRMVPRDQLIELFWPDARTERGANNLSIAIHQIRSCIAAISPDIARAIVVKQGLYGIDASLADVDLWEVQSGLARARQALERHANGCRQRPSAGGARPLSRRVHGQRPLRRVDSRAAAGARCRLPPGPRLDFAGGRQAAQLAGRRRVLAPHAPDSTPATSVRTAC